MDRITNGQPDTVVITWKFTTTCNFACEYCPPSLHDGRYGFPDFSAAVRFLKQLASSNKKIYVDLLGGETTLWPKLIDFMTEIKNISNNIIIQISTNGSRTNAWWKRYCNANVEMNSVLHFTYHPASIDDELFYKNLALVSEKHFTICSLMLDVKHIDKTIAFFERIKSTLPVDCVYKMIRPLFDHNIDNMYTEKNLEKIRSHNHRFFYNRTKFSKTSNIIGESLPTKLFLNGEQKDFGKMLINKEHEFTGWSCSAGQKRFIIGEDGSVFPCHPLYGKAKYRLGNINDTSVALLNDHIICPESYCSCLLDAAIGKFKNNE